MEIFKKETHIDFLAPRKIAAGISILVILFSLGSLMTRGLNFGIEFKGGVVLEAAFPDPVDLPPIRQGLEAAGFDRPVVQHFGSSREVTVQLLPQEGADPGGLRDGIMAVLQDIEAGAELRRVEFVGPQVGKELREQGALATIFALVMILAYVSFRFQWKFSLGAVAALVHDVIITLGFFSVTYLDFDLSVLAAVLAVVGYSLNDTIVIFDRIRENMLRLRKKSVTDIMNISLNQTLSRTIMTGLTTLVVLIALFVLGGEAVSGFAVALIVGIVVGTYSSVYVASAFALQLKVTTLDIAPPTKEEAPDALP